MDFRFVLVVLSTVLHLGTPEQKTGVLLYMASSYFSRLEDLWYNTSLSEGVIGFEHRWSRRERIEQGTDFRSPLIDRLSDLEMQNLIIRLINSDGETIRDYTLWFNGSGYDVTNLYSYDFVVRFDTSFGPFLLLESYGSSQNVSLMFLSNQIQEVFLFYNPDGSPYNTGSLPQASHFGCFTVDIFPTVPGDVLSVDNTYQCALKCLADISHVFFGIFTFTNGTITDRKCVCLQGYNYSWSSQCTEMCDDNRSCGANVTETSPSSVAADLYTFETLYQMLLDAHTPSTYNITYPDVTPTLRKIHFQHPRVMSGLYLTFGAAMEPVNFTVSKATRDCLGHGFNDQSDIRALGEDTQNVKIFTSETWGRFAPIEAWCLFFDIGNGSDREFNVTIELVGTPFLLADQIELIGTWNKDECVYSEIIDDPNIVPIENLHIDFYPSYVDTYRTNISGIAVIQAPWEAAVKLKIAFPSTEDEFWVKSLNIFSTSNVTIKSTGVITKRRCTNLLTGLSEEADVDVLLDTNDTDEEFISLKASGTNKFCAEKIVPVVHVNDKTSGNDVFEFNIWLLGCRIAPALLGTNATEAVYKCNSINLLVDSSVSVSHTFEYIKGSLARLRPSEKGISIPSSMQALIGIHLDDKIAIEVRKVVLQGNLSRATLSTEDNSPKEMVSTQSGLEFTLNPVSWTKLVEIETFPMEHTPAFITGVKVTVEACMMATSNTTAPSTASSTYAPNTTTSATTKSSTTTSNITTASTKTSNTTALSTITSNTTTPITTTASHTSLNATSASTISSSATTQSMTISNTSASMASTSTSPYSTSTTNVLPGTSVSVNTDQPRPNQCLDTCASLCKNTVNKTLQQIQLEVNLLIKNLTVLRHETSSYRRTKESAEDQRTSSKVVGTGAIVVMVIGSVFFVALDAPFFLMLGKRVFTALKTIFI